MIWLGIGNLFDPEKHHRRSIRLRGYDYTQAGLYFVTICTKNRECLFGEIIDGSMQLNEYGQVVAECWQWLSHQYPYVDLDEWVVMPNHLHGIIVINPYDRGDSRTAPTMRTAGIPIWQRNYYEHIIRNERALIDIRRYIAEKSLSLGIRR